MALAAVVFAGQAVPEFVQHLGEAERDAEINPIARRKELMESRQLGPKRLELHQDEQQRRRHQQQANGHRRRRKKPTHFRIQPIQNPLGVEALEADREQVRQRAPDRLAPLLGGPFLEPVPLVGRRRDQQPFLVKSAD